MSTRILARKMVTALVVLSTVLVLTPNALLAEESFAPARSDARRFEGIVDPAIAVVQSAEFQALLDSPNPSKAFEEVQVVDHFVPLQGGLGDAKGATMHVTELFTVNSFVGPPRAVIFLTGPDFKGSFWTIPVEGFNGPAMAAQRGYFAYAVDYLGVGESSKPADGSTVTYESQVTPIEEVIDYIKYIRRIPRVDLVGEAFGSEVAAVLAAQPRRVRSVVLSVVTYRELSDLVKPFFSPEFEAWLRSAPDGYYSPNFLDLTLSFSPNADLREYVLGTQLGVYPTGPALEFFDFPLPIIDASKARVPALVIGSEFDPFPVVGDNEALAAEWGFGRGAKFVQIQGGHHAPRIESEEVAGEFFAAIFDFLDNPYRH